MDFRNHTRTNCTTTFADRKAQALLHRDWAISSTSNFRLSPGITISVPRWQAQPCPSRPLYGSRTVDGSSRRTACDGHPRLWSECKLLLRTWCVVHEPGLQRTWPRSTPSRSIPRRRRQRCRQLHRDQAACGTFQRQYMLFLSVADTNDFDFVANVDRATLNTAVTTVPRPEIENTSSIGIKERLVDRTWWLWDVLVNSRHQFRILSSPMLSSRPSIAAKAEPAITGMSSPG